MIEYIFINDNFVYMIHHMTLFQPRFFIQSRFAFPKSSETTLFIIPKAPNPTNQPACLDICLLVHLLLPWLPFKTKATFIKTVSLPLLSNQSYLPSPTHQTLTSEISSINLYTTPLLALLLCVTCLSILKKTCNGY